MFGLPDVSGLVNSFLGVNDYYAYRNYDFKVRNVTLDDDNKNGSVDVDVYIDGSLDSTTTINVTKYHGKWYIEN